MTPPAIPSCPAPLVPPLEGDELGAIVADLVVDIEFVELAPDIVELA